MITDYKGFSPILLPFGLSFGEYEILPMLVKDNGHVKYYQDK
jgi:hypothetical protein